MNLKISTTINQLNIQKVFIFGLIIVSALISFEIFNYSTTVFALTDLLGDLRFAGIRWATILAFAFCGIDFAGIARLFSPGQKIDAGNEAWYLFGAWLLAASMNAVLTWWGVSLALLNHNTLGNSVIDHDTLVQIVPLFVAVMVWVIRVLIIGTFSASGDRLFGLKSAHPMISTNQMAQSRRVEYNNMAAGVKSNGVAPSRQPVSHTRPDGNSTSSLENRPEPTYNPLAMGARNSNVENTVRRM
ncbi:MAG: hypothetical protein WCI88_03095 [Chloroflexota bacterium]